MYTVGNVIQNVQSFHCTYDTVTYIHGAIPLVFLSPCSPFVPPSTYLAPSSCDRNRPPRSQVACKLTPFAPPSPNYPTPSKFPNPNCLAPNNDDLGNIPALAIRNINTSINTKVFRETWDRVDCKQQIPIFSQSEDYFHVFVDVHKLWSFLTYRFHIFGVTFT
jgi:hypothetical protein